LLPAPKRAPTIKEPQTPLVNDLEGLTAALADRYRLERELGGGGMATVYLAQDLKHRRQVALKVLKPEIAAALGSERFLREVEIAARLNHPHIVPLHDSGLAAGYLYYVMPYVEGESLRDLLRRENQLALPEVVRLAREIADGLGYAHGLGIVHRDIKPENILLSGGHAVIADFGIAQALIAVGEERLTSASITIGTPAYMSPEQASGERNLDARTDLFSLACVVYEALAGDTPFTGSTPQAVLARQSAGAVPSLRVVRETVPLEMEAVLLKALARVPADRFATVAEFAEALAQTGTPAIPSREHQLPAGRRGRNLFLAALLILGGAAVVLVARPRDRGLADAATGLGPALSGSPTVLVGVLPPEVPAGEQASSQARLLQQILASELMPHRGLAVVDPLSLNGRLDAGGAEAGADPVPRLRSWGIRYAVRTAVTGSGKGLEVSYVLTDTRQGAVVATGTFAYADETELPALARVAAGRLLDALDVAAGGITKALDLQPWLARAPARLAAVKAFVLGTEYAYRGLPGGREYYERALAIDSTFIAPRVWLVSSLNYRGDTAAARRQVRVLQSLKPGATPFEQAMIGWAEAVVEGDLEARARHLQVALGHSPQNNVLLYNLGQTLTDLGRVEEAVAPVRAALESRWRFAPLYTLWGEVAIRSGALRGLRETLEGARSITPQRPLLAGLLEALTLFEGDAEAARLYGASFRAQLEGAGSGARFAELIPVYRSLAQRARELGDHKKAAVLLQRAVDAEPAQPTPRLELAQVLIETGDRRGAELQYRAAGRAENPAPEVLYLLGDVAALLGRNEDARSYFTRYLEVARDGPDAVRARERLRALERRS
jgi:Tfp pilus assembly protein PilF